MAWQSGCLGRVHPALRSVDGAGGVAAFVQFQLNMRSLGTWLARDGCGPDHSGLAAQAGSGSKAGNLDCGGSCAVAIGSSRLGSDIDHSVGIVGLVRFNTA